MKIWIESKVRGIPKDLIKKFDESLFHALKPMGLTLDVMRFDGSNIGDHVELNVGIFGITQQWNSVITEQHESEEECYFTDEGVILPFPIQTWKHVHRIRKIDEQHSLIIEDINYTCSHPLLEKAIKPILKFQFSLRTPVYQKLFNK